MAPDTVRYSYRYGPLVAAPGQNLILVGPVTIERPPGEGYATRIKPDLIGEDGKPPPVEQVHMHHAVFLNLSRRDEVANVPQRFYAFAEEKTIAQLPAPYGYPVELAAPVAIATTKAALLACPSVELARFVFRDEATLAVYRTAGV